jgi:hypothetical protein
MKNANYFNGNQTRDLLARNAMHQPTAPPRFPQELVVWKTNK